MINTSHKTTFFLLLIVILVGTQLSARSIAAAWPNQGVFRQAAVSPMPATLMSPTNGGVASPNPRLTAEVYDGDDDTMTVTFYGREIPTTHQEDFTIIVIPDTQHYICGSACPSANGEPETFESQIDWILDNQAGENIQYVTHVGDIVEHGSDGGNEAEWELADEIISPLETAVSPQFPDGIPYGVAVGNKDQGEGNGRPDRTYLFNETFGVDRFEGRSYYGGHFGSNNDNYYTLFQVGEIKFLGLYLEYDSSPDSDVLDWADDVLKAHPDRWTIVTTHYALKSSGSHSYQGKKIYRALRDNPNFFLMLGGHLTKEKRRDDDYHGRTIHTLMADYQNLSNGGDGWFRIMRFQPNEQKIRVKTYSSTREEYQTDSNSDFTLDHDIQSRPFSIISSFENVQSGSVTASWENLEIGKQYEWYVVVDDGEQRSESEVFTFNTIAPTPTPLPTATTATSRTNTHPYSNDSVSRNDGPRVAAASR